jgi:RHS repeat-associated protein
VTTVTETAITGAPRVKRTDYDAIEGAWPAAITNALGQVTRLAYHCGLGVLVGAIDPNGVKTRWQYDNLGRQMATFDDVGNSFVEHYDRPSDSRGLIVNWVDDLARNGTIQTDILGRETLQTETAFDSARQLTTQRFYDAVSGQVGEIWRPYGANGGSHIENAKWTFRYDEIGRLVFVGIPGEVSRTIAYDGLKATRSENGIVKGYRVEDELGRVITSADVEPTSPAPNHEILTTFEYGPFGNPRHVHLPGGSTIDLAYDHLGRRTLLNDPDAGTKVVHYNAFGEIVREQLPGQLDVIYSRDQLGRAIAIQQGTSSTIHQFDSAAHGVGKPDFQYNSSGVMTAFTYRPNGMPESTTWTVENGQFRFDWQYSAARLVGITYPDIGAPPRFGVTIGYGSDGNVGSLHAMNSLALLWRKSAVADAGQVYREEFGDGLLASIRNTDPVSGRLTHISTGSGDVLPDVDGGDTFTNRLQSIGYVYFADGKLQTRSDFVLANVEGFEYDGIDRVTRWTPSRIGPVQTETVVQYGYDDTGNLTSRNESSSAGVSNETYTYGENGAGPHALTSGPLGSYAYDTSGRQIVRPGQPVLSYNMFNLPARIQRADGSVVDFVYDADGVRVVKKTAASSVISLANLYERRTDGNGTSHVFYLPGDGRVVGQIWCDGGGSCAAPTYFHPDRYGTIDTATSSGAVVGHEKRDPYGRPYTLGDSTEPGAAVTIGFTGAEEDAETGLVNLQHRLYDPRVGRFISPDPLVKDPFGGQQYNRYAYAGNNPLSFVDPSGLQTMPPAQGGDPTAPPLEMLTPIALARIVFPELFPTSGTDAPKRKQVARDVEIPSEPPVAGAPTAPYDAINSTTLLPPEPTFSTPPSPSQNHVNDSTTQGPMNEADHAESSTNGRDNFPTGNSGIGRIACFDNCYAGQADFDARHSPEYQQTQAQLFGLTIFVLTIGADLVLPGSGVAARGVLTAAGGMFAYRIITSDPGRNFASNAARGLAARGPEIGNALLHRSLSVFDSLGAAASRVPGLAHALAREGHSVLGIAELRLSPELGAQAIKTLGAGHWSFTGQGLQLQSVWFQTFFKF